MRNQYLEYLVIFLAYATPIAVLILAGIIVTQSLLSSISTPLTAGGF